MKDVQVDVKVRLDDVALCTSLLDEGVPAKQEHRIFLMCRLGAQVCLAYDSEMFKNLQFELEFQVANEPDPLSGSVGPSGRLKCLRGVKPQKTRPF
ncbi:MAG TPA: hypothetical protein VMT62_08780 [Syntrophorhabdaceae bacterium]|nr:hypothetical protein [Syntrophorhabdaceae bacterium]